MTLVLNLQSVIKNQQELSEYYIENYCLNKSFQKYISSCFNDQNTLKITSFLKIEAILDYLEDELNTGKWDQVPISIRRTYTIACYIKVVSRLKLLNLKYTLDDMKQLIKCIDKGLLLGAPLKINVDLLTSSATLISQYISRNFNIGDTTYDLVLNETEDGNLIYNNLDGEEIRSMHFPSLEQFCCHFRSQNPVKLLGCMDHWPAREKWKDINYILKVAGERTVPVEIGAKYVDENWSQQLMTLREFIETYYIEKSSSVGYVAQHNLFDQIPELANDIHIPEYCFLSEDTDNDPEINCWFGPSGTISPLHFDARHNVLTQIFGSKIVLLISPDYTNCLYPYEDPLLFNTSQVDPVIPDFERFPKFEGVKIYKCVLNEGEMLFIPKKWWHHVIALERSFSVSFWWD